MGEHGNEADVPLPAAAPLMQRRLADDFMPVQHQQRQVALEIRLAAPLPEQCAIGDRLLDEQAFLLWHRQKKLLQPHNRPVLPTGRMMQSVPSRRTISDGYCPMRLLIT